MCVCVYVLYVSIHICVYVPFHTSFRNSSHTWQPRATSAEKSLQDPLQQHANGRAASIPPAPIPAAEHVHPAMMGDEIAGPLEPDLLCVPSTEIQVFSPCKSLKSQSPDPGKRLSPDPGSMRGKNASGLSRSKNCSPEPAHRSNTPSIQSQRSSPHPSVHHPTPSVHHPTVAEMQPLPPVKATKERGDSAFTAACSAATVSAAGGGPAGAAGHTLLLSSAVVARMDRSRLFVSACYLCVCVCVCVCVFVSIAVPLYLSLSLGACACRWCQATQYTTPSLTARTHARTHARGRAGGRAHTQTLTHMRTQTVTRTVGWRHRCSK